MKYGFLLLISVLFGTQVFSQLKFQEFFTDDVLRIDMVLGGDSQKQLGYIDKIFSQKEWGGRKERLDIFHGKGNYKFNVYDARTEQLIYTDGFSTLFQEWQTTEEASSMMRSFENTFCFPEPKKDVHLEVVHRIRGEFVDTIVQLLVKVDDPIIRPANSPKAKVKEIMNNGDPSECIDIVLIAEGYTKKEEDTFFKDASMFTEGLFTSAPFNERKSKISIRAVMAYSEDEGVDDPNNDMFMNTALGASYNTLYSDRYLMTENVHSLADYAGLVPYDQIVILVNTEKYGGGGVFNFYSINSTRGRQNVKVFIHEFGHSFAGLGDEYYSSEVSYDDFYPRDVEPWEPNLTTLVDFDSKWKNMMDADTPVPTPAKNKFSNKVGVFEGGGYVSKGVYRPYMDCRMKTNEAKDFCPVCSLEVIKTIDFYTAD